MGKKRLLLLLILSLFMVKNVDAACSYEEQATLNSEVAQIKAYYEVKEGQYDASEVTCDLDVCELSYYYLNVYILNLSDDFYIEVTNDVDSSKQTYTVNDMVDGVITIRRDEVSKLTNMKFSIYSTAKTNCYGDLQKVIYLALPRFNGYSKLDICKGHEDYYLCQPFVTFAESSVTFENAFESIKKQSTDTTETEENKEKTNAFDQILGFILDNKYYFLIGILVIGLGTFGFITYRGKNRL